MADGIVSDLDAADVEGMMDEGVAMLSAEALDAIASDPLMSTTKSGTDNRQRCWGYYLAYFHDGAAASSVAPADICFPPSWEQWNEFLSELRPLLSSHSRFRQVVDNVCSVGRQFKGWIHDGPTVDLKLYDPRWLYREQHDKAMTTLLRHYGQNNTFVEPLGMTEARNGTNFCDDEGLTGVLTAASWAIGALTGRRCRSLVQVLLSDLHIVAEQVIMDGQKVMVPAVSIEWRCEKFMDKHGKRSSPEHYRYKRDYAELRLQGWGHWVYRSLVLRNAFPTHDPLLVAADGQVLHVRPECTDWFLLPHVQPNEVYCDTEGTGTRCVSRRVDGILKAMGFSKRGYSTFRKGLATRSMTLSILHSKGLKYETSVEDMLVRVGGWDLMLGYKTLKTCYISKVIDRYACLFGLSLGRRASDEEWADLLAEYMGKDRFPAAKPVHPGRKDVSLIVRFRAMHGAAYRVIHDKVVKAMRVVLVLANRDRAVMPVARYMSSREAVGAYFKAYPDGDVTRMVGALKAEQRLAWQAAVEHELAMLANAFACHCACIGRVLLGGQARVRQMACDAVHNMCIGAYDRLGVQCVSCQGKDGSLCYHFCVVQDKQPHCKACDASLKRGHGLALGGSRVK